MTGVRVGRVPKRRRGHRVKRQSAITCGEDWIDTNNDTLIQEFEVHESRDDHIILKHQGYTAEDLWNEMDRNSSEVPREFLETGRTGRRNAMPDILHPQGAEVSTADLPSRLQQLVTTDPDNSQPSSSKAELGQSNSDVTEKKDSCS